MDKYDGIHKASARLTNNLECQNTQIQYDNSLIESQQSFFANNEVIVYVPKRRSKKGKSRGMLLRLLFSAMIFLSVFGMSKSNIPILVKAAQSIKTAVTQDYDKNQNKELGEVKAVTLLMQELEKDDENE